MRVDRRAVALLGLAAAAAAGWLAWQAACSPSVPFFSARAPGEWLIRAAPPSLLARPAREQEIEFRKRFSLDAVPGRAVLRVRLYRSGAVELNGRAVGIAVAPGEDWKQVREREVAALLRPGENELVLRARASFGPPACWAALDGPGVALASDATWTAAPPGEPAAPARLARTPMLEWDAVPASHRSVVTAVRASAAWLAAFALVAAAAVLAGARARARPGPWLVAAAALGIAALWWRDRGLDLALGFDAFRHLEYVRFILERHRLPLASDGWAMYQPPLYYVAAAAVAAVFGENGAALRALNALAAIAQCAALLGSLRILFPAEPRRVFAGFALGALVPMQLYLAQYLTNELWCAALVSCALWLCLRISADDVRSPRAHLALGALLGAALLAKVSALVAAAVALAVLAGRLWVRGERAPRAWLETVGCALLALVAVAGWHYARVAWHFGSPFVGNWDAATGHPWWQDPGYRAIGDYLRFGESLTRPVFSACNGCADGLYSTLWGDGLIGGMADAASAPPWRWELMWVGYWLALAPTFGVALGLAAALVRLAREPRAEWFLVVGTGLALGLALVSLSLRLPFYAQCKAFYALSALVPFAAFGGLGLDLVARRLGRSALALWTLVGVWGLCSYASYWIR